MEIDIHRGNKIYKSKGIWYYCDSKEPVAETHITKPCGHCGKGYTKEGHDGCIGALPNVMNACCGHGVEAEAYVQFSKDLLYRGKMAINYMEKHK